MRRSPLSQQDLRLQAERQATYKGTARIRLANLYFEPDESRKIGRKKVETLKKLFRKDVQRLEPRNYVPALVDRSDLDSAIQASRISAGALLSNLHEEPPLLQLPARVRLSCLHGRHRLQAARETLPPNDAWWTVDLYLADTNLELRTTLVEEYSYEEKPSDGEIYRKVRQYERDGNICFKTRWKARLSHHGQRNLQQLFDHGNGELTAAFDELLDIPGIWGGMRISTLHKMISIRCDEEVLHYLGHIRDVWYRLLRHDKVALRKVDQATVKALELRAPRYSRHDAQVLQGQLLGGQIFGAFSNYEREEIWGEICSTDGLIPSLFTFFEDLKYLSACSDCLKRLVKVSRGVTVSNALQESLPYSDGADDRCVLEMAEATFVDMPEAEADPSVLRRLQLWLSSMRHHWEMPAEVKKRGKELLAKAGTDRADEKVLSEFAALADRLGFRSSNIHALMQRSSDRQIARNALLQARKSGRYQYDEVTLEAGVTQIVALFATAVPLSCENLSPVFTSDDPDASGNRCGFPDKDSQQKDSKFFFLPYLFREIEEQGEYVTSLFVRRSVYLAFFGRLANLDEIYRYDPLQATHASTGQTEQSEMDGLEGSEQQIQQEQQRSEQARQEQARQEQVRQEQARQEQERLEQERLEQERLEQARQEQERLEQERLEQERLEQERLEQERLEQKRLEQERLEQERLEQERLEQERLEQARQEQERLEQERLEQERQEQARLEQERLEQERLEQERLEQERLEQERLEQERLEQKRLEQERLEQERLEQERQEQARQEQVRQEQARQEQERLEQERLEQERLEQERLEQERLEQERLEQERLEQERLEQERLEQKRLEQERLEQERLEQERLEQERLEQERLEQERIKNDGTQSKARAKKDRKRHTQIDMESLISGPKDDHPKGSSLAGQSSSGQQPNMNKLTFQPPPDNHPSRHQKLPPPARNENNTIRITFNIQERNVWRTCHSLDINPSDPSEVQRVAVKYMRKGIRLYDTELNILAPQDCFEAATANGKNLIFLIPETETNISRDLEASITELVSTEDSTAEEISKKRGRR